MSSQAYDNCFTRLEDLIDDAISGAFNRKMQGTKQAIFAFEGGASGGMSRKNLGLFNEDALNVFWEFLKQRQGRFIDIEGVRHDN